MTANFEQLLERNDESDIREYVQKVARAYSTRLAIALLDAVERPFARVIEDAQIDHGECRRRLTIDWHLPTLAEALPEHKFIEDTRFVAKFTELNPFLVVPVFLVRRGRLMNNFSAEDASGQRLYICDHDEAARYTQTVLGTFWTPVKAAACRPDPESRRLVDEARKEFYSLPMQVDDDASDLADSVVDKLRRSGMQLVPGVLERIRLIGRYLAKRHIIWLQLPCGPGRGTRLTLSYRTRFAAEYSVRQSWDDQPGKHRRFRRVLDGVRRIAGQEPYQFAVPLWMSAMCNSFHFQMTAPSGTYFTSQRFVLEKDLHQSEHGQVEAFKSACDDKNAYVAGMDEAGGPVAHLYARRLPGIVGNQLYAYTQVRERPPGTTAMVMWLCLGASAFLWFYWWIWQWFNDNNDSGGLDIASLFLVLPVGVVSIWFAQAFREDVKPRIPLVSRLGLVVAGAAAFYALLSVVVRRGACASAKTACPAALTVGFSRPVLFTFATVLTALTAWLAVRRFKFQNEYQQLQNTVTKRYVR